MKRTTTLLTILLLGLTHAKAEIPAFAFISSAQSVQFLIEGTATTCQVDWGDGIPTVFQLNSSLSITSVGTAFKANTPVKVYITGLTSLQITNNSITSLELLGVNNLQKLDCSGNKLKEIDVSNCQALIYLSCSNNKLGFSCLPKRNANWTTYIYAPQQPFDAIIDNGMIDLTSEFIVETDPLNNQYTNYTWYKKGSNDPIWPGSGEYEYSRPGLFSFRENLTDSMFCVMTNDAYPLLNLSTVNMKIERPSRSFEFTFTSSFDQIVVKLKCNTTNTCSIDWGDGNIIHKQISGQYDLSSQGSAYISGKQVKISGEGILKLDVSRMGLSVLDVSKCPDLAILSCEHNQLKSIDVSNCTYLEELYANFNQLSLLDISKNSRVSFLTCAGNNLAFGTLPQPKRYMYYSYAPQNQIVATSTNGTVDLSKHAKALNGKNEETNTTFIWYKRNSGTSLNIGVDYISNVAGVFSFPKLIGDSVYCIMTNNAFSDFPQSGNDVLRTVNIDISSIYNGLKDYNSFNTIQCFPNPVRDELQIEFKEGSAFEIFNLMGVCIYRGDLTKSSTVDTSTFSTGEYIIRFRTDKYIDYKKIIKI